MDIRRVGRDVWVVPDDGGIGGGNESTEGTIGIDGEAKIYVDDVMEASARRFWVAVRNKAAEEMKMLGEEVEAVDKRESSDDNEERRVDCLWWEFNLEVWVVDVAEKNGLIALGLFWITDLERKVTLETMEALASMAQRYSVVYMELCEVMGELYSMQGGSPRAEVRKKKRKLRERYLDSFRKKEFSLLVLFDGALKELGVHLFRIGQDGVDGEVVFACEVGLTTDFKYGF